MRKSLCIVFLFMVMMFPNYSDAAMEDQQSYEKSDNPYSLYMKAGYQYDDNVRLEPLDTDIVTDKKDYLIEAYFSGRYDLISNAPFVMGIGYDHYQTWHQDYDEYDITGSTPKIYAKYHTDDFIFGVSYIPSFFWVNAQNYLTRHRVKPEITWKISEDFHTKLSYSFNKEDYRQETDDGRDGDINEVLLDFYYGFFDKSVYLFGGIGYADKSANIAADSYDQLTGKLGLYFKLPSTFKLSVFGRYYNRKYDTGDLGTERTDKKYLAAASLSCNLFYEWLLLIAEYDYTKNNSDVSIYEYERNIAILSLALQF